MTAARALVERIDQLAAAASDRPWRSCRTQTDGVITEGAGLHNLDEESRRFYGGCLVFESCHRSDQELVCALVNAWPEIRTALLMEEGRPE